MTIVEVVPEYGTPKTTTVGFISSSDEDDCAVLIGIPSTASAVHVIVKLHPSLEEFTALSSGHLDLKSVSLSPPTDVPVTISHVVETPCYHSGRTFQWNASLPTTDCGAPFHLRRLGPVVDLAKLRVSKSRSGGGECHVSLTLRFVHSSDEGYDRYFLSLPLDDDDMSSAGGNAQIGEHDSIYEIIR